MQPFSGMDSVQIYGGSQHHMWNNYVNSYGGHAGGYDAGGFPGEPHEMGVPWWSPMGGPGGPGVPGPPRSLSPSYEVFRMCVGQVPPGAAAATAPWAVQGTMPTKPDGRGPGRPKAGAKLTAAGVRDRTPPVSIPRPCVTPPGMSPGRSGPMGHHYPTPPGSTFGAISPPDSLVGPDIMASPPPPGSRKRGPGRPRAGPGAYPSPVMVSLPGMLEPSGPTPPSGLSPVNMVPESQLTGSSKSKNKTRYVCEICQKRFSTAWYVRVHSRSHDGKRLYTCHNCGKGYMLLNVLQVHLRKCKKSNPLADPLPRPPPHPGVDQLGPSVPPVPPPGPLQLQPEINQQTAPKMSHSSHLPLGGIPPPGANFPPDHMSHQMSYLGGGHFGPLTGAGGPGEMPIPSEQLVVNLPAFSRDKGRRRRSSA
jgi:hypothetical protein